MLRLIHPSLWIHRRRSAQLLREEPDGLLSTLTKFRFPIAQDRGWNYAEVTDGGVLFEEINFRTMESKLVLGLYFVGRSLTAAAGSVGSAFNGLGRRDFWLDSRFPQVCAQKVKHIDEHPVSLNSVSARNLRFLDRVETIIYPWTRCRKVPV